MSHMSSVQLCIFWTFFSGDFLTNENYMLKMEG